MKEHTLFSYLGAFVALLALLSLAVPPALAMTEEQAIQIAANYCRAVGEPVTAPAVALPPEQNRSNNRHWQPRWQIMFENEQGRQATVEVVDASGNVADYSNNALSHQRSFDRRPAGAAIPQDEAIRRATAALRAAGGNMGELVLERVEAPQFVANAPLADSWWIRWGRQFQGVPCREQGAVVELEAETGRLHGFTWGFSTPAPGKALFRVTRSGALRKALARLAATGIPVLPDGEVKAEVVQLNTFWQPGGSALQTLPESRVAWTCRFQEANVGRMRSYEVWLDADSGAVIGGSMTQSKGVSEAITPQAAPAKGRLKRKVQAAKVANRPQVPHRRQTSSATPATLASDGETSGTTLARAWLPGLLSLTFLLLFAVLALLHRRNSTSGQPPLHIGSHTDISQPPARTG